MRIFFFLALWLSCGAVLLAQRPSIEAPDLCTLRAEVGGRLTALPILTLGSGEQVAVSFDQLSHEHRRYVYRLVHCDYRWQPTEGLFPNEVVEAHQELTLIEDVSRSRNTMQPYTHYRLMLPNAEVRPLLSGNYRLDIYDEDDPEQAVATMPLAFVEPLVGVGAQVSANTDIDWNEEHQQLSMSVEGAKLNARDLRSELHTVVLQNGRWDNAVCDAPVTQLNGTQLLWQHQPALIFPAGNEYRRFEMLSTQQPGTHVDGLQWIEPLYHATLLVDEPQRNYLHIDDQNGTSVVRTTDNPHSDTEADYVMVHFALQMPKLPDAEVYVDGQWTMGGFAPAYRMDYDASTMSYRAALFLKQGYYSYRYLALPHKGKVAQTAPTEGNHFQASNDYTVLVYHRSPTLRHDRLVGVATVRSK